jgi:hypothetical protein
MAKIKVAEKPKPTNPKVRKVNGHYLVRHPRTGVEFVEHSPKACKERIRSLLA